MIELTLRDQIALGASEDDLRGFQYTEEQVNEYKTRNRAEDRYAYADAMMKAREGGK